MSEEKTGGQIAYEAFYSSFPGSYLPWDAPGVGDVHDAWETAAAAGAAPAHERTAELLTEVNELRARIAELERLLAEAVDPTAQDYDNAAEIMRLRDALAEAAGHVEPVDQNSELAIARWQALAAGMVRNPAVSGRYHVPRPGAQQCEADGVRNGPDGPGGTDHYWTCTAPGTVEVDGMLMCEDHAGELGYGPKREEYGFASDEVTP